MINLKNVVKSLICGIILIAFLIGGVVAHEDIRINAGGSAFNDSNGTLWQADNFYNTGKNYSTNSSISNTSIQQLYKTERYDEVPSPELNYLFNVSEGNYTVKLHFAEIWPGAFANNRRVFNVSLQGTRILSNFDIYSEVGSNKALIKEFNVTVNNSLINVTFQRIMQNPKISGIEIIKIY